AGTLARQAQALALLDSGGHLDVDLPAVHGQRYGATHRGGEEGDVGLGLDLLRPGPSAAPPLLRRAEQFLDTGAGAGAPAAPLGEVAEDLAQVAGLEGALVEGPPAGTPLEALGSAPRRWPGEAEAVVLGALVLVAQHVVGFLHFLELVCRRLVARVAV